MEVIVNLLKQLNYTMSSCESITGGLFSKTITDISGSSQVFKGSIVSYTKEIKIKIVKIKEEVLNKYGVVSPECALIMAQNIKEIFNTDIAISFTGNAGPSSLEKKPIGLSYIAIVFPKYFLIEKLVLQGTRTEIRNKIIKHAQEILKINLTKIKKESSQ